MNGHTMVSSAYSAALPALVETLLDFERAPGRYALALREPRPLFDATHAVMLLAAGRPVEDLPPLMPGQHTEAIRLAARFFVRTVLLRPGGDHYNLLGLTPDFEPQALRDHYRLMIRLTHPDFAASGEAWPADAASRINIAHDVLGSVVKRAEYDASLKTLAGASPLSNPLVKPLATALEHPAPAPALRRAAVSHGSEAGERATRRTRKIALAALGAGACATLLWLMTPGGNDGSLVAKRSPPAASADTGPDADSTALAQAKAWLAEHAELTEPASDEPPAAPPEAAGVVAPTTPGQPTVSAAARAEPAEPAEAIEPVKAPARPAPKTSTPAPAKPAAAASPKAKASAPAAAVNLSDFNAVAPSGGASDEVETRLALGLDARPAFQPHKPVATSPLASSLTMAQVQPQLALVLSGLESGKGENVVRWLDGSWREHPAANAFVSNYQRMVAGHSVLQLGKVQLHSRSEAEQLVVDGVVELYLQENGNAEPHIQELQVSAHFRPHDGGGQPLMTQVVLKRP